jgi:hypothetical protein
MFVEFSITDTVTPFPNTLALNADDKTYPFTKTLDTHCEMSERPKTPKLLAPGQWPVFTYARNRIWHVEGDIIGTDMADYDAQRLALLAIVMPPAVAIQRYTAILTVGDENGNFYTSEATLTSYSIPVEPLYPAVNSYMLEWEADDPFCYRVSDGIPVFL